MRRDGFIWNEEEIPETVSAQIRKVLMRDWDPIGVDGIPEAENEYDNYIPRIDKLLISDASAEDLQDYLFEVVSERMGMSPPATWNDMEPAAAALKQLEMS